MKDFLPASEANRSSTSGSEYTRQLGLPGSLSTYSLQHSDSAIQLDDRHD